jgi:integrase
VIPTFGDHNIQTINRKSIQTFLAKQAEKYSRSSLRSMRLVLCMTLAWAERNGEIQQPNGWLDGIRLPKKVGGRTVHPRRTDTHTDARFCRAFAGAVFDARIVRGFAWLTGEEAIGLKPADLDDENVLHVRRVIYDRQEELLEKEKRFPLDAVVHADLIRRIRALGEGQEWIFLPAKVRPSISATPAVAIFIPLRKQSGWSSGGWHDFRHTLVRMMRRGGENPVVISGVVGHKSANWQQRSMIGRVLRTSVRRLASWASSCYKMCYKIRPCKEQPPKSVNGMGVGERGRNRTFNLLFKGQSQQLICFSDFLTFAMGTLRQL